METNMSDKYTDEQQPQTDEQDPKTVYEQLRREIAQRRRLEEALDTLQTEQRDFVHAVSHDLREPLRKISSFGLLLKESLGGKLEEEDQENLQCMIDGAKRMARMLEEILTYSRVCTKTVTARIVDLNELVEQLKEGELGILLEETGATLEIPEPLPQVLADDVLIQQLLQHLVIRAIKCRRQDVTPRILIRAEQIDSGEIRVDVQDNGRGLETKNDEDVFRMFARLYREQEKEEAGTGLTVCKKIVDKHGGRMGFAAGTGTGSTFWFTLTAPKDGRQHGECVLIAESEFETDTTPDETDL
jgi:light-regulated signal transduction histidine kinase (bacteriophytochrome)